jgi:hypothetical protein
MPPPSTIVLIGQADLLPALYTEMFIPETVAEEINQRATPEPVRRWPIWIPENMMQFCLPSASRHLVLMDDREGSRKPAAWV